MVATMAQHEGTCKAKKREETLTLKPPFEEVDRDEAAA